jgi:hypothetical protein
MNNRNEQQQKRPKLDFQEARVFTDTNTKLAVRVMRAETEGGFPQFRTETGETSADGWFFKGHRAYRDIVNGRVSLRKIDKTILTALMDAAEDFITHELQAVVDKRDAQRKAQGNYERPGLKTLSKQDKAKRESEKPAPTE